MCAVSFIGDHYQDKWKDLRPIPEPPFIPTIPYLPETGIPKTTTWTIPNITREEFDALKKDVEEMKKLLIRAKAYDEKNNEPNCEMEEKVALLKQIAKLVGVDLSEVFGKDKTE